MFQKLDLFTSSGEGMKTPTLLGPWISDGPNRVDVFTILDDRQSPEIQWFWKKLLLTFTIIL
jgi:hypothetical protein